MSQSVALIIKAILGLGAAPLVLVQHRLKHWGPRLLLATSLLAALAYFNFGTFHTGVGFIHYHEQFHYLLGAKYFPELGYDGLYAASLKAEAEGRGKKVDAKIIRDLRNNRKTLRKKTRSHQQEVRQRFSAERWNSFCVDHEVLSHQLSARQFRTLRLDHGYNPTPAWTFLAAGLLKFVGPLGKSKVVALALLDPILLILLFAMLWRTFGRESMTLCLIVFGLAFLSRFAWVGGGFLRQDWLAALVVGVCLLKKERWLLAGLLLGLAGIMRIFPLVMLVGPLAVVARQFLRREPKAWFYPFAAGLIGSLAVGLVLGALAGRGWQAWFEFFDNIQVHRQTWSANNVGFENMLVHAYDLLGRPVNTWFNFRGNADWLASAKSLSTTAPYLRVMTIAVWLGIVALASVNKTPFEASLRGIVAIFAAISLSCYYYAFLLLLPLVGSRRLTAFILLFGGLSGLMNLTQARLAIYGIGSWLLCIGFAFWIVPQALHNLRRKV